MTETPKHLPTEQAILDALIEPDGEWERGEFIEALSELMQRVTLAQYRKEQKQKEGDDDLDQW